MTAKYRSFTITKGIARSPNRSMLRAIGYDGWLTVEMIPPVSFYKYAPETLLFNTSRAMDALLALPARLNP